MNELSLYILDIIQNSLVAQSKNIELVINEDRINNKLLIEIIDNGRGIRPSNIIKVTNPFYTTRTTRNVGLGLPLLKELCELANGNLDIESIYEVGTKVKADFEYNHIDRLPIGNITETILSIIMSDQNVDFEYTHIINNKQFIFNTKEIKAILNGVSINQIDIIYWIKNYINNGLKKLEEDL